MLFLKFRSSSASWTIGPAASIEFRGAEMFLPNAASPVARFQGGGWTQEGKRCTYVECRSMLSIHFEDNNGGTGPVTALRTAFYLRGVYAFAGRERIAKLDPLAGVWCRTDTQEHWPRMRVVPAPRV
jgi:hypothetical protein